MRIQTLHLSLHLMGSRSMAWERNKFNDRYSLRATKRPRATRMDLAEHRIFKFVRLKLEIESILSINQFQSNQFEKVAALKMLRHCSQMGCNFGGHQQWFTNRLINLIWNFPSSLDDFFQWSIINNSLQFVWQFLSQSCNVKNGGDISSDWLNKVD